MSTLVDGWQQVRAGLALIECSKLASWQESDASLVAATASTVERMVAKTHSEFGRVISWVVFSVGCEYVLKGACLVRGFITTTSKRVLRAPTSGEDLATWVKHALAGDNSVLEPVVTTGTFGELPILKLVSGSPQCDLAAAAFHLLRESMRNRDAHQYVQNVRAAHFQAVPNLFVPALNVVLRSLDQTVLRSKYPGAAA